MKENGKRKRKGKGKRKRWREGGREGKKEVS